MKVSSLIIFIDAVGFSKELLYTADQKDVIEKIQNELSENIFFTESKGVKIWTGDGLLWTIKTSNPHEYIKQVLKLLRKLRQRIRLKFRAALHFGKVEYYNDKILNTENICGNEIIICERLMSFGDENHILVSGALYKEIQDEVICKKTTDNCKNIGKPILKHNKQLENDLYNYFTDKIGNENYPKKLLDQKITKEEEISLLDHLVSEIELYNYKMTGIANFKENLRIAIYKAVYKKAKKRLDFIQGSVLNMGNYGFELNEGICGAAFSYKKEIFIDRIMTGSTEQYFKSYNTALKKYLNSLDIKKSFSLKPEKFKDLITSPKELYIAHPLYWGGNPFGVLCIDSKVSFPYSTELMYIIKKYSKLLEYLTY